MDFVQKSGQDKHDFLDFSREIAVHLLSYSKRPKRGRPSTTTTSTTTTSTTTKSIPHCIDHITDGKRWRCSWCHKNTVYMCIGCESGFHPDCCFHRFHFPDSL